MSGQEFKGLFPLPLTYNSSPVQYYDVSDSQCNEFLNLRYSIPTGEWYNRKDKLFIRGSPGRQLEALVTLIPSEGFGEEGLDAHALIDSGCTGSCIDSRYVNRYAIPTKRYPNPLKVFNADGSNNDGGLITEYVEAKLVIGRHTESICLAVTNLVLGGSREDSTGASCTEL